MYASWCGPTYDLSISDVSSVESRVVSRYPALGARIIGAEGPVGNIGDPMLAGVDAQLPLFIVHCPRPSLRHQSEVE